MVELSCTAQETRRQPVPIANNPTSAECGPSKASEGKPNFGLIKWNRKSRYDLKAIQKSLSYPLWAAYKQQPSMRASKSEADGLGLVEDLRIVIKLQKPENLGIAMYIARALERKQCFHQGGGLLRTNWGGTTTKLNTNSGGPLLAKTKTTRDMSKETPPALFFKRLTHAEMAEPRAKDPCFNCDMSLTPWVTSVKRLFWIKVLDDNREGEEEEKWIRKFPSMLLVVLYSAFELKDKLSIEEGSDDVDAEDSYCRKSATEEEVGLVKGSVAVSRFGMILNLGDAKPRIVYEYSEIVLSGVDDTGRLQMLGRRYLEEWQARQREKTKEWHAYRKKEEDEERRKIDEYREIGMRLKEYPEEEVRKARKLVSSFIRSAEEVEEKIEAAAEKGELTELVLMVIWNRLDLARRDEEKDVVRSLDLLYRRIETEILKRDSTPAMRLLNDLLNLHDGFDDEGWLKQCRKRMVDTFPREDPFSMLVPAGFDMENFFPSIQHHGRVELPPEDDDVILRVDFVREVDQLLQEVRSEQQLLESPQGLDPETVAVRLKQQEKQKTIHQVEALLELAMSLQW
ncbi:hypothetical protein ZIOFF_031821 [Zingiber officinale]|uniref:Protein PALE CRESS, chloroplastic n=1 Tax=Zingiber officinale TaxID=94328 RepID=A0A8J5LA95_ZINOF|nr:hypothetical protein ZIOFF_031821 [Zingiber officinale]